MTIEQAILKPEVLAFICFTCLLSLRITYCYGCNSQDVEPYNSHVAWLRSRVEQLEKLLEEGQ